MFQLYSLDVIASCCFGIDTNSVEEPDNQFLTSLKFIFKNTFNPNLKFLFLGKKTKALTYFSCNKYINSNFCLKKVLFPTIAIYLSNKGFIEFFASKSFRFVHELSNEIIQRRRNKLEVRKMFDN